MNFFSFHLGDYAEATGHLSFAEDAALSRLIRKIYATEKPLPRELAAVERLIGARTTEERVAVKVVLEEFFFQAEDGWHNKRCDEELAIYHEKSAKARRSANARWHRGEDIADELRSHGQPNAIALRPQSEGNAIQSPVSSSHSQEGYARANGALRPQCERMTASSRNDEAEHAAFERIAAKYPTRTGEQNLIADEHVFRARLEDGEPLAELEAGVERFAKFAKEGGYSGPSFVMPMRKFFDRQPRRWTQAWDPPPSKQQQRQDETVAAGLAFLARGA